MTEGRLRLLLARHAKSSWDDPTIDDHDRVLNKRGQRQARELGDWLASRGYDPEEVLCSSSLRTRQTFDGISSAVLHTRPDVHILTKLYSAGPETLAAILARAQMGVVLVIAHNPGIADFAASLLASPPSDPEFRRYPTSACAVIDFQVDSWEADLTGQGSLRDFFLPLD